VQTSLQTQLEQIADGLAGPGYAVVDQFLGADEVLAILNSDEFTNRKLHFRRAGIGKQQEKQFNEGIRGDYIQWIDPSSASPAIQTYLNRVHEITRYVNQELFLSLKDAEIHLTTYPIGTFYKRHLDQFKSDDHRKLSVICYLNNAWKESDGGQLRLFLKEGTQDLLPVAGRLVCFRSDLIEHEVLPATRERLSLTGWLTDKIMS